MLKFQDWYLEYIAQQLDEALPTLPVGNPDDYVPQSPMMQKLINLKRQYIDKQPAIDWEKAKQQQQQQLQQHRMQGTKDDPVVQEQKYNILKPMFITTFNHLVGKSVKPKGRRMAEAALDNLAKSFTMNIPFKMSDLENVLIAVHQFAPRLDDRIRQSKFGSPSIFLNVLIEVFDSERRAWYDPAAHTPAEQYPPRSTLNNQELEAVDTQWENSGYKYQPEMPTDDRDPAGFEDDDPAKNRVIKIGDHMQRLHGTHLSKKLDLDTLWLMTKGEIEDLEANGYKVDTSPEEIDKIRQMASRTRKPRL